MRMSLLDRLIFFNSWSPVGRTLWEGLGGAALLEEVSCMWEDFSL